MRCGWCQGPANTGLGVCSEGGFLAPRNTSVCPASQWFFDECPGTIHLVACRHCSRVLYVLPRLLFIFLSQLVSAMVTVYASIRVFVLIVRTTLQVHLCFSLLSVSCCKQCFLIACSQAHIVSSVRTHSTVIPEMESFVQVSSHKNYNSSSPLINFIMLFLMLRPVCDCNDYNATCNSTNGNCVCNNAGVSGARCTE